MFFKTDDQWSSLRSTMDVTVNFAATLFYSISIKPCRDRRPRLSGKQQILLFKRLLVCSHTQSKRFFFSDRRGRRSLQAKNSNRINTSIRSGNSIVFGASRTPVPTGKNSNRIDTPNVRFFSAQGIWKIVRRPRRATHVALPMVGFDYASLRSG